MKPVIGILAHPSEPLMNPTNNPENKIGQNYTDSIQKAGGLPFIIPIIDKGDLINEYVSRIDGLLVPGGIDIHPSYYHEEKKEKLGITSSIYDSFEMHFLERAEEKRIPILGICRGIQLLNVYHGGTLYQDLSYRKKNSLNHKQTDPTRWAICHSVLFEEGSKLESLFGKSLMVNSFHHQACKDIANNFKVTARAEDGIVEGIEDITDYPYLVGVQWHPEGFVSKNDSNMPLFVDFVEHCRKAE